jgi:acetyl esterase
MFKKIAVTFGTLAIAGWLAWALSPWPSAMFYRALMNKGGVAMNDALAKHVVVPVSESRNMAILANEPDVLLDVYRLEVGKAGPVIVWIHGGAFLSGSKDQISNYLRILAAKGYAVAGVNYTLAPGAQYPTPVRQISSALRYLSENAALLGIDPSKIVLAGDSAGAQIAAQIALVISQPEYAQRAGFAAPIARDALRGVILHCGFHDPEAIKSEGAFGGFVKTATWSYFGVRSLKGEPRSKDVSIVANIGASFPPMFISAGNADPLGPQSKALAEVAKSKGVAVDALFFRDDYNPPLQHEYQFDLDGQAGRLALDRTEAFLNRVLN